MQRLKQAIRGWLTNKIYGQSFSYQNIIINLYAKNVFIFNWVKSYVEPFFAPVKNSAFEANWEIVFFGDPLVIAWVEKEFVRLSEDPSISVHSIVESTSTVLSSKNNTHFVKQQDPDIKGVKSFFMVEPQKKTVWVFAPEEEEETLYIVARFLRNLFILEAMNNGAVHLHASGMELNGSGLIIVGKKGSGKTTLLLELVKTFGAKLITNDHALLAVEKDKTVRLWGLPMSIGVKATTLNHILKPEQRQKLRDNLNYYYQDENALKAVIKSQPLNREDAGKIYFLISDLCRLLGCGISTVAPIRACIVPEYTEALPSVRLMRQTELNKILAANTFQHVCDQQVYWDRYLANTGNLDDLQKGGGVFPGFHVSYHPCNVKSLLFELMDRLYFNPSDG